MNLSKEENGDNILSIDSLIESLRSKDGLIRQKARISLVKIGEPALDALINAFQTKEEPLHWETAKALSQIGTEKAAQPLVDALEDKEFSIRWIAAEGLIHIGAGAVKPLLSALLEHPDSIWLREGAHHVIHDLIERKLGDKATVEVLSTVNEAINHVNPEVEVVSSVKKALDLIK